MERREAPNLLNIALHAELTACVATSSPSFQPAIPLTVMRANIAWERPASRSAASQRGSATLDRPA